MVGKPCVGRTQGHPLAQGCACRGHRDPRPNSSVMLFPSKRHELASRFNCELSWQIDSDRFPMTIQKPITLQEAKSIARHLGLTLRKVRSGDYRVNFRDGNETTAYYTDTLEDAVNTAVEMARKRALEYHRTEPGDDVVSPQPFKT